MFWTCLGAHALRVLLSTSTIIKLRPPDVVDGDDDDSVKYRSQPLCESQRASHNGGIGTTSHSRE